MRKTFLVIALAISAILAPKAPAQDDISPSFAKAIELMGNEISKYVKSQEPTAQVAIGSFVGPSPSSSNAGARIVHALKMKLQTSLTMGDTGTYNIAGEFRGQKLDGKFVTVIEASIKDALGSKLHSLRRKIITDEEEGVAFFGPSSLDLTIPSPVSGTVLTSTGSDKTDAIIDSIVKPRVNLDSKNKHILRMSPESPYGIEILLKNPDGYSPMPIDNNGQLAKISLGEHDIYAIRIHNDTRKPIGAKLSIDGINVFAMSENPSYAGKDVTMALCPCSKSTIKGWHMSDSESAEFQIAKFGKTVAAKFGTFENMGTMTVRFFDATAKGELDCPSCDDPGPGAGDGSKGISGTRSIGTAAGKRTDMKYKTMDVAFGSLLGSVSARYVKDILPNDLPTQ